MGLLVVIHLECHAQATDHNFRCSWLNCSIFKGESAISWNRCCAELFRHTTAWNAIRRFHVVLHLQWRAQTMQIFQKNIRHFFQRNSLTVQKFEWKQHHKPKQRRCFRAIFASASVSAKRERQEIVKTFRCLDKMENSRAFNGKKAFWKLSHINEGIFTSGVFLFASARGNRVTIFCMENCTWSSKTELHTHLLIIIGIPLVQASKDLWMRLSCQSRKKNASNASWNHLIKKTLRTKAMLLFERASSEYSLLDQL